MQLWPRGIPGASLNDAQLVIGLGPGFTAQQDCHAVVETNRGHWLGRVFYEGQAEPNTGTPGPVKGYTDGRVLRAPAEGHLVAAVQIGASLKQGNLIATVAGAEIRAPFDGVLRGLIHPKVRVTKGLKIGDLDPRADERLCFTLSDKSLTIGGGVLEAILASDVVRPAERDKRMQLAQAFGIHQGDNVAFVGGGGKTTAMFRLAEGLARPPNRLRVLITTSTRIFAAQIKLAPAHVIFDPARQTISEVIPQLNRALDQHGQVLLVGPTEAKSGKAFGIAPETIDALAATGQFDVILNEADGSRMRPFKAPAAHEPVIPSSTTLVVPVVGLDVLDQPLNEQTVHRATLVSGLSETRLDQPVTVATINAVLSHTHGGLKNVPALARVIPLLNKAEDPVTLATARRLAASALQQDRIDRVAIGAVQHREDPIREVHGRTAVVVLAAGGSSRFGSPKQLARWAGQTFIERTVEIALGATEAQAVLVVLGAEVEQSQKLLQNQPVKIVVNQQWAAGQSTSMQAGLAALPDRVGSVVFLLVDLPQVTADIVDALIQRHRETLAPIVWPEFEGKRGNPVLFDRALFPALQQISGDTGGRPLIKAYQAQAERVAVTTPVILQDFDRPEDLEGLENGV